MKTNCILYEIEDSPDVNRDDKPHKTHIAFRPPPDVGAVLRQAEQATGASVTDLLIRCVRRGLVSVVADIQREQQQAAHILQELTTTNEYTTQPSSPFPKRRAS
jgi:hypothetical protein